MNSRELDLVVNMITVRLMGNDEVLEGDIDEMIDRLKLAFPEMGDELFNLAKAEYTARNAIKLETGAIIEDKKHKKWFINRKVELDMKFWERYKKYLVLEQGFSNDVVNTMDDILDKLTDLLGDPQSEVDFQRRGLTIGDVQSGKTSNYTGLICKAADSNYKVIVLLTGTIEKLRKQTQMRLDEGFVGFDSSALVKDRVDKNIGVSKFDKSVRAAVLTTTLDDFKKSTAKALGFDLNTINAPVLFVVKKNVTVLKRLNKWLKTFNTDGKAAIEQSLLLIDDEADNASVNTNPEDKNPTKINEQITELLALFRKASYIGFTATPYANIFIDPFTDDQMISENLFPKDYIYSLNAPSNYIGARDIFGDKGEKSYICNELSTLDETELEELLPMNHKKDHVVEVLPSSLKRAIYVFLVANVIRDLRNDKNKHRSMLINVSRFTDVQHSLKLLVNNELKRIQDAAKLFSKLDNIQAEKDTDIQNLKKTFQTEYANTEFIWEDILANLYRGIGSIIVKAINQSSDDKLDYEDVDQGLRVIAIGGLSLSRGLTLEGLMVSYLYRSTRMYDTLLQMGRWFGYRPKYEDLCRIYLTKTSIEWYRHISDATDELRRDVKRYEDTGLTPMDFGLRVRSDINTLLVTARNKMRTAGDRTCTISLSEEVIESTDLYTSEEINISNFSLINKMIKQINMLGICTTRFGNSYAFLKVPKQCILDFLDEFEIPASNEYMDPNALIQFITNYGGNELDYWDVGFVNGSENEVFEISDDSSVNYLSRSFSIVGNNEDIARMSGKSKRLGTTADGKIGIEINSSDLRKRIFEIDKSFGTNRTEPRLLKQSDYFKHSYIQIDRRPLLNIYNVILKYNRKSNDNKVDNQSTSVIEKNAELSEKYKGRKVHGIGVGIPILMDTKTKYASYKVNKIYQSISAEYDLGDEE